MIVNRQTTPFAVFGEDTILTALTKITDNKSGIVFCVDEHGILTGSFSDGDFRRWITSINLHNDVQTTCIHLPQIVLKKRILIAN